jgi:hypothetical protein
MLPGKIFGSSGSSMIVGSLISSSFFSSSSPSFNHDKQFEQD